MDKKSLQKKNKYMTIKTLLQRRTSYAPYSGKIPLRRNKGKGSNTPLNFIVCMCNKIILLSKYLLKDKRRAIVWGKSCQMHL